MSGSRALLQARLRRCPTFAPAPTAAHFLGGRHVQALQTSLWNLAVGQIYKVHLPSGAEAFGRVSHIIEWTGNGDPQSDEDSDEDVHEALSTVKAMVGMTTLLLGREISHKMRLVKFPDAWDSSLVNGDRQLVDTDARFLVWESALDERIHALEFLPWERNMVVYPGHHFYVRGDVRIAVRDHPDTPWVVQQIARPACAATCLQERIWDFDAKWTYWRCCTLCDGGEGRWYHDECLTDHVSLQNVRMADRPPWLQELPDMDGSNRNEVEWQTVRELPMIRGCPLGVGGSSTLSFERVLDDVRSSEFPPPDAGSRIDALIKKHTYQAGDERGDSAEDKYRLDAATRLFGHLLTSFADDMYRMCPQGHIC